MYRDAVHEDFHAAVRTHAYTHGAYTLDDPLAIDERGGDARRDVSVPQPPNKLIRVIGKLTD